MEVGIRENTPERMSWVVEATVCLWNQGIDDENVGVGRERQE